MNWKLWVVVFEYERKGNGGGYMYMDEYEKFSMYGMLLGIEYLYIWSVSWYMMSFV